MPPSDHLKKLRQRSQQQRLADSDRQQKQQQAQFYAGASDEQYLSTGGAEVGGLVQREENVGLSQVRARHRTVVDELLDLITPVGDVAILAKVQVADGTWQIWLGGDRRTPILVMAGLQRRPSADLDLIGPGKNDWVVSISWQQSAALDSTAIAVRYGKQDPSNNRTDWQILDNPANQHLRHYGMGFWCSQVFNYAAFNFTSSTSTPVPDSTDPPPGLGIYSKSGYHGQTGGESTHSVEYWENISIQGALTASAQGGSVDTGFIVYPAPLNYTGTHQRSELRTVTAEWEGSASGPGYLGPENTPCSGTEAVITGTALAPRRGQVSVSTTTLQLQTQSYSFAAYNGVFKTSVGTHDYDYQQSSTYSFKAPADLYKRLEYLASCQEYINPSARLWSIGFTDSENWPSVAPTTQTTISDRTSTLVNNYEVMPGVIKNNGYEFLQPPSGSAQATTHYWSPNAVISAGGGRAYSNFNQSGEAYINQSTAGRPSFYGGSSQNSAAYLDYKGSTFTLVNPMESYYLVWRDKPDSPYPVGYKPVEQDYKRDQNNQIIDNDQNNPFKKSKVIFDISKYTGALVAEKVAFTETKKTAQKKALSMKRVQAIAKPGTYASVEDIRYWSKG